MSIKRETEATFMAAVVQYARLRGWWVYHTRYSRGSAAGLPDLLLIRGPRLVFAELKGPGGRLSAEQAAVLEVLRATGVGVYVWSSKDWGRIEEVLR